MNFPLWIAAATFLAGVGKFLDDYYIRKQTRTRIQDALTRWFLWLNDLELPTCSVCCCARFVSPSSC
jgi:hypothetical protein